MTKSQKGAMVPIHGDQGIQKLLLLILALCTFANANEVEVFSYVPEAKALVSDTEIVAGHMVRLKIRANGDKVVFPKIDEIDGVKVLEEREIVVNRPHYINGVLKKERTIRIYTFAPHHDVTIPSYNVEIDGRTYRTKPIKIKVMPVNAQNTEDSNKFFLHLETDKKSAMIGEPIVVTVSLSLKIGTRLSKNPIYTRPAFEGFFSEDLGEEKVYIKRDRQITEVKYLLTPHTAGSFSVGPARAKIGVSDRRKLDMFGRAVRTYWVPIASNSVKIDVAKKSQESDLVGRFTIESSLDPNNVKANEPVTLTVKIAGNGALEGFEFPDFEMDGVTVYSDDAEVRTTLDGNQVKSDYAKSFTFISDHDFTIPARRISVYDTKSKTVKYLETPSYDVHVEGSRAIAAQKSQSLTAGTGKVHSDLKQPQKSMLDTEEGKNLSEVQLPPWWMIASAFVLGLLAMYLFQYFLSTKRKRRRAAVKESEALQILYPHTNRSKAVEDMVRTLYAKENGDKTIVIDKTALKMLIEKYENNLEKRSK
ncbi:protein BatD [Sulfurovum sp. NBC37-1]|uniref:protein BatD n=1 Tax=Sulfurovum sp. (strain NBC37-1) TaxID=387093 RepID=UPI000321F436|nr:protein BatD [Sulfurovum sp. NBC37-1]